MINSEKCIRQSIASCPMFTNTFLDFVMQTLHRSLKWSAIALGGCLLSSTIATPARADLFSASLNSGDTLLTRDSRTGLEWLDLSVSKGLTYRQVINGEKNLTTQQGFRYATLAEIQNLLKSADIHTRSQPYFKPAPEPSPGTPDSFSNFNLYAARALSNFLGFDQISSGGSSYGNSTIYFSSPMFGQPDPMTNRVSLFALSYNTTYGSSPDPSVPPYSGDSVFPYGLRAFSNVVDINTGQTSGAPSGALSSFLVRSTNISIPPTQTTPEPTTGLALLLTTSLAITGYKKRQSQLPK
jgi:hypothetical protein